MNFIQKWGKFRAFKTVVEVNLMETGIDYKLSDRKWSGRPQVESHFISYDDLGNDINYGIRTHPFYSLSGGRGGDDGGTIVLIKPSAFFVFRFVQSLHGIGGKQKVVVIGDQDDAFLTIIHDKDSEKIIDEIYKKRNAYLKAKYVDVPNPSREDLDRMVSLGVIRRG